MIKRRKARPLKDPRFPQISLSIHQRDITLLTVIGTVPKTTQDDKLTQQ